MAKDPALLWYWNDWNGGTMTMTRHLKGCYIDLLSAQFNSGPLSLDQIKTVLGTDQASWTVLSKKFKREVNSEGIEVFFNERMEAEKNKRIKFIKHQSENGKKGGRPKTVMKKTHGFNLALPKQNPLENENENRIKNKGPSFEKKFDTETFLTNQIWKEQFCMTKKIGIPKLEQLMKYFVNDILLKGEFVDNLYRYFTNWFNKLETLEIKEKIPETKELSPRLKKIG